MTKTKKFDVGQTVILLDGSGRREPKEVVISKVGRTLAYVQVSSWYEQAFYLDNGAERRPANSGGIGAHIWTLEEWADRQRRDEITKALAGPFQQSTATLERILAILDEETKR
jgi:hypothetical protein